MTIRKIKSGAKKKWEKKSKAGKINGYIIYVDIMTGENCRQFSFLIWISCIGQFVYPVEGEGMGVSLF